MCVCVDRCVGDMCVCVGCACLCKVCVPVSVCACVVVWYVCVGVLTCGCVVLQLEHLTRANCVPVITLAMVGPANAGRAVQALSTQPPLWPRTLLCTCVWSARITVSVQRGRRA